MEIPTQGKNARFSLDGRLLEEIKLPVPVFKNRIFRVGGRYVARNFTFDEKETTSTIRRYDKDFKLIRELRMRKEAGGIMRVKLLAEYHSVHVNGDTIYLVESGKETKVSLLDGMGRLKKQLRLGLPPVKVTAALKEAILRPIKENPEMESRWSVFERQLVFPDATPGIDYFAIAGDRIVARTYRYHGDAVEFAFFNLKGKDLKRQYLPYTGRVSNVCPFSFARGRYYYLRENVDDETWELHVEKVW